MSPIENNVPCKTCNQLRQDYLDAWLARLKNGLLADPERLIKAMKAENDHKQTCQIIRSTWYQGLWPGSTVTISEEP